MVVRRTPEQLLCIGSSINLRLTLANNNNRPNMTNDCIWAATWDFQQCGMCDQQRFRPACAYAQSDQSLCLSLEYSMSVKLLTENNLEFLSLKGGCRGSSESTLVKMPHCWKSRVTVHCSTTVWLLFTVVSVLFTCLVNGTGNRISPLSRRVIITWANSNNNNNNNNNKQNKHGKSQELEVLPFSHLYSLRTKNS